MIFRSFMRLLTYLNHNRGRPTLARPDPEFTPYPSPLSTADPDLYLRVRRKPELQPIPGGHMKVIGPAGLAATLVFLAACAPAQEQAMTQAEYREAIEEVNARFVEAAVAGDGAALTALYTSDAIVLPPNMEPVRGQEAIRGFWSEMFSMGAPDLRLTTMEVMGSGDFAYEVGRYSIEMSMEGSPVSDTGNYLVVWRRTADGWKLHADMWNSDQPAEGM
jgi:ketosteroid isomerase-like protein